MKAKVVVAVLAMGVSAFTRAASEVYYDSQGFENLAAAFVEGSFADTSSQSLSVLHASNPQLYALATGSTIETLWLNRPDPTSPGDPGQFVDSTGTGGTYALGMMASPMGTPVYNSAGVLQTYNQDAVALSFNSAVCANIEALTISFDLSLAALKGAHAAGNAPDSSYYYGEVEPVVRIIIFDLDEASPPGAMLQGAAVTGVRPTGLNSVDLAWSSHSVTLPLSAADLTRSGDALITISGGGSNAQGENTYIAIDNLVVTMNTANGCTNRLVQAVPINNHWFLIISAGLLPIMVATFLARQRTFHKGPL
ncbi:MAG: hypothetical protein ACK5ME_02335 [Parahaliea sp.]